MQPNSLTVLLIPNYHKYGRIHSHYMISSGISSNKLPKVFNLFLYGVHFMGLSNWIPILIISSFCSSIYVCPSKIAPNHRDAINKA